jgi:hypothetical protein
MYTDDQQRQIEPQAPIQDSQRAYLQSAPSGVNSISIKETHTAIGVKGVQRDVQRLRVHNPILMMVICFNLGLLLPTVFSILPSDLRLIFGVLAVIAILVCAGMSGFIGHASRWLLASAIGLLLAGIIITLYLSFIGV